MDVAEIKDSVIRLKKNQLLDIASLINQILWDDWDNQIAKDFDEGRLDFLMREAEEAINEGDLTLDKSKKF